MHVVVVSNLNSKPFPYSTIYTQNVGVQLRRVTPIPYVSNATLCYYDYPMWESHAFTNIKIEGRFTPWIVKSDHGRL